MDDKLTISTFQLFQRFPDQKTARAYLESRRWPDGVKCPVCGLGCNARIPTNQRYCEDCR